MYMGIVFFFLLFICGALILVVTLLAPKSGAYLLTSDGASYALGSFINNDLFATFLSQITAQKNGASINGTTIQINAVNQNQAPSFGPNMVNPTITDKNQEQINYCPRCGSTLIVYNGSNDPFCVYCHQSLSEINKDMNSPTLISNSTEEEI
jgi:preprotein translocase subunit SecG